jgi:hypothetical protein
MPAKLNEIDDKVRKLNSWLLAQYEIKQRHIQFINGKCSKFESDVRNFRKQEILLKI